MRLDEGKSEMLGSVCLKKKMERVVSNDKVNFWKIISSFSMTWRKTNSIMNIIQMLVNVGFSGFACFKRHMANGISFPWGEKNKLWVEGNKIGRYLAYLTMKFSSHV